MARTASIAGIVALSAAAIVRCSFMGAAAADPGWRDYADPTSGTRVEYPTNMFSVAEGPFQ